MYKPVIKLYLREGILKKKKFFCKFLQIFSDKTIYTWLLEFLKINKQNPIEKILYFTILPKLYFGNKNHDDSLHLREYEG